MATAKRAPSKRGHLKVADAEPVDPPFVEPEKLKTLAEAVAAGNYLEILLAQQREIATTVGAEKGPAKAALHRQLSAISAEIEKLREAARQDAEENGGDEAEDAPFDAEAL